MSVRRAMGAPRGRERIMFVSAPDPVRLLDLIRDTPALSDAVRRIYVVDASAMTPDHTSLVPDIVARVRALCGGCADCRCCTPRLCLFCSPPSQRAFAPRVAIALDSAAV